MKLEMSPLILCSLLLCFSLHLVSAIEDKFCTCNNIPRTKPTYRDEEDRILSSRILNGTRNGTEVLNYVAVLFYKYRDLVARSHLPSGRNMLSVLFGQNRFIGSIVKMGLQ